MNAIKNGDRSSRRINSRDSRPFAGFHVDLLKYKLSRSFVPIVLCVFFWLSYSNRLAATPVSDAPVSENQARFYSIDSEALPDFIEEIGSVILKSRIYESNDNFDDAKRQLARSGYILGAVETVDTAELQDMIDNGFGMPVGIILNGNLNLHESESGSIITAVTDNSRDRNKRLANHQCHLEDLYVNFHKDLGYNFVRRPLGFNLGRAVGSCSSISGMPASSPKNAVLREALSARSGGKIDAPTCVVDDLQDVSWLIREEGGVRVKLVRVPSVVPAGVTCR